MLKCPRRPPQPCAQAEGFALFSSLRFDIAEYYACKCFSGSQTSADPSASAAVQDFSSWEELTHG